MVVRKAQLALALGVYLLASVVIGADAGAATSPPSLTGERTITTFAGGGQSLADGVPATSASFAWSASTGGAVAVDTHGNVYIADPGHQRVREVSHADGKIRTIAGTGERGYTGDGGPATAARLYNPQSVAVDQQGNVYIGVNYATDTGALVRKVSTNGTITTFAGGGHTLGDGGPATSAQIGIAGLAVDGKDDLLIADGNSRVRKVTPNGTITTFAGGGQSRADGVPATSASLSIPDSVAVDGRGNVYIAEYNAGVVRKVTPDGKIATFEGGGQSSAEGVPATQAASYEPLGVAADARGYVYISHPGVRKVDLNGRITTITTGMGQSLGDGGPASQAYLTASQIAADAQGQNLYIVDFQHGSVRRVSAAHAPSGHSSATTATVARTLETVLTQMASGRATLRDTLGRASRCSLSAQAAATRVAAVALSRRHALDLLVKLSTQNTPTAPIRALLVTALTHSIAADLHYRDWLARQRSRCSKTTTADSSAAQREDRAATTAKRAFLVAFNPLARQLHLRTWTADEI
jgi:hypothetical protein